MTVDVGSGHNHTGDQHALQGKLGNDQSGNYTSVSSLAARGDWHDIKISLEAGKKSLELLRQLHADGRAPSYARILAPVLMGDPHTPLKDRSLEELVLHEDHSLHNRSGVIKKWCHWIIIDKCSKQMADAIHAAIRISMKKESAMKEYTTGRDWLVYLFSMHDHILPILEEASMLHSEFSLFAEYMSEAVIIMGHDGPNKTHELRGLVLALHACCLGMWLIAHDLEKRKVVEGQVSLWLFSFLGNLPRAFEEGDGMIASVQQFESVFKDWKHHETKTNHRQIVEELLIRRDQEMMTKYDHPSTDRSADKNTKMMSRARATKPFTEVPLPKHLVEKYPEQISAYVKHRLNASKFEFSSQKHDWAAVQSGELVFASSDSPPRPAYTSPSSSYPSKEKEVSRPKCSSQPGPSAAWFRAAWLSDGGSRFEGLKTDVMKSMLYWSGKAMGSSRSDTTTRLVEHLRAKYGEPLPREAALALNDDLESGAIDMRSVLRPGQEGSEDTGMKGTDDDPSGRLLIEDDGESSMEEEAKTERDEEKVRDWQSAPETEHTLAWLRKGYDRMKCGKKIPHPTVPSRSLLKWGYRVLSKHDSLETGCHPRPGADAWPDNSEGVRESNRRHVRGKHAAQTAAVSMTLDFTWALFFATKGIWSDKYEGEERVIVEIDLEAMVREGRPLVDVSTYRSSHINGLVKYPEDIWAKSASEVLSSGVPVSCLSGQTWKISSGTTGYEKLLSIHPAQGRVVNAKGGVDKFGGYGHWFKAFHDELSKAQEKSLANSLRCSNRRSLINNLVITAPRKRSKTTKAAAAQAQGAH